MTAAPATAGVDDAVAAYEALRAHVLAGSTAGGHAGLVLLLRQGVAAWIARRCVDPVADRPATNPGHRRPTRLFSDDIHARLVQILAGMALTDKQELHP